MCVTLCVARRSLLHSSRGTTGTTANERAVIQSHEARTFYITFAIRIVKNDAVILRERFCLRVNDHRSQEQAGEEKKRFHDAARGSMDSQSIT
jgi:hypothetical protein